MGHRETRGVRRWLERLGELLSGPVVFLVLLANGLLANIQVTRLAGLNQQVTHTHEVLSELEATRTAHSDADASVRGYVTTGDHEHLDLYHDALARGKQLHDDLLALIADNPVQRVNAAALQAAEAALAQDLAAIVEIRAARGREAARELLIEKNITQSHGRVRDVIAKMMDEEVRLLRTRQRSAGRAEWFARGTIASGAILGTLLVALLYASMRREANARRVHAQQLGATNAHLETLVEKRTAELIQSNEGLRRSNEELERFASVASHDLQEPLRKLQAFSDRLLDKYRGELDAVGQQYLDRMQQSAQRMRRLIDDLLHYSRVSTKPQVYVPVELQQIFNEVLGDLERRIEETDAKIESEPLPRIEADPLQMRQLFQNILGNALKFRHADMSPHIRITCRWLEEAGRSQPPWCEIRIADNGIGFDEIYLDRIFHVFQRLHGRSEYEGTGMGLAICRRIVERHRGELTAHSVLGEGATFIITLPVEQIEAATT